MHFIEIENIAFKILDYPVSYVELIGTLFGLASVYFASRANILTWGTGIVNEIFLFILFFQVQLYVILKQLEFVFLIKKQTGRQRKFFKLELSFTML